MSTATIHASAVLRRRAIAEDGLGLGLGLAASHDDDAYWAAAPRLYDFSKHQLNLKHHDDHARALNLLNPEHDDLKPEHDELKQEDDPAPHADPLPQPPAPAPPATAPSPSPSPPPPSPSPSPPRRRGPRPSAHLCLLALQDTGLEWGVRKRVHYVARNRAVNHAHDRRARALPAPPAVVVAESRAGHGRDTPAPAPAPAAVVAESAGDGCVATPAPAVKTAAEGDEASSSNVKTKDLLGLLEETEVDADGGSGSGKEVPAVPEEMKTKRRRRKNGRGRGHGFSLRPKKRIRKTKPVPKVEVFEEAVAEAGAEEESERKVAARADQGKRKRKDVRRPGRAVTKRTKKATLPVPEVERKMTKTEKKLNLPVPEEERKVAKTERKRNLPVPEDEITAVKAEKKRDLPDHERTAVKAEKKRDLPDDERKAVKVVVAVKRERKSKTPLCARRVMKEEPETRPVRAVKTEKPVKAEEATAAPAGVLRGKVDRWAATRYAACEASLVGILRRCGARAGKPVPRGTLRQEARKYVGDTGLLDHLLKHTADKVPRGCAERIRRRHNADGAMEYWLEPAELAALRREVGVDPYWVPPPGWKRGDPVSADGYALKAKRQVEELTAELAGVKRHMKQLLKAQQGTMKIEMKPEAVKAYIPHEPHQEKYECVLKANGNLEKQVLSLEEKYANTTQANGKLEEEVLFLKEKYEAVLEKNSRMEQQLTALSTSFLSLKEGMRFLNDGEQQLRIMGPEQRLLLCAKECTEADKQESNGGSEASDDAALAVGAGDQLADDIDGASGGKRSSRKCSVRPQGSFQWPDAEQPSTPRTPGAAFMDDDENVIAGGFELPPTPASSSSTNAAAFPVKLLLPAPDSPSPVQPTPQQPASCSSPMDADLQESVQPQCRIDLQHTAQAQDAPSLPLPCGLPEGKTTGGSVGTELALATPTY